MFEDSAAAATANHLIYTALHCTVMYICSSMLEGSRFKGTAARGPGPRDRKCTNFSICFSACLRTFPFHINILFEFVVAGAIGQTALLLN